MNANAQLHRRVRSPRRPLALLAGLTVSASLGAAGRADREPAPAAPVEAAIAVPRALAALPPPSPAAPLWQGRPRRLDYLSLGELLPVGPSWRRLEANSEQRQPLHLGASPRDQVLRDHAEPLPRLPLPLKALAESQLPRLRRRLGTGPAEFEAWPTQNDVGRLTWVVSRWRPRGDAPWRWLDRSLAGGTAVDPNLAREPALILPERLEPSRPEALAALVDDFLLAPSLYTKPRFSECVWTTADGALALAAFSPSSELAAQSQHLRAASPTRLQELRCQALPPPPRLQEHALTFVLRVTASGMILWPDALTWVPLPTVAAGEPSVGAAVRLPQFPARFGADYQADVRALTGAAPLQLQAPPRQVWLRRKSSADPQHQLEELLQLLEERYQKLGLVVQRQRFTWRGVPQSNLIAILRGRLSTANRPVLLADHIDTALCEVSFAKTGQRLSVPGADDNVSATAALLRAAAVLRELPREHDIWLVHLTGEEFPSDDLGARAFVQELLRRQKDITGLLLLDMIGHRPARGREFQLNPGGLFEAGAASVRLAQLARALTGRAAAALTPRLVPLADLRNYLYNTDGLIFAESGYPVVLFNEVMNRYEVARGGYHDLSDTAERLDLDYAVDIAKVAITTAAVLAQQGPPEP